MTKASLHRHNLRSSGFTLLELMVVVLIMGLLVGLVSVNMQPDERRVLDIEAQRLARLLELAARQSSYSGRSLAWTAEDDHYTFLQQDEGNVWLQVSGDDSLRPRHLPEGMRISNLKVENGLSAEDMRIVFSAYGQTAAFTVALNYGAVSSRIMVSPIGVVSVQADIGEPR